MNKTKLFFKYIMLAVLIIPCMFVFSACQLSGDAGPSAYEIAVEHGFTGSEVEWLESLQGSFVGKGDSAYDIAVKHGFVGSEEEWLESLKGESGNKGETGDNSLSFATNKAMLSAVSVLCNFEKSVSLGQVQQYTSAGGGVIIKHNKLNGDAYIITNYHVVYSKESNAAKISSDISVYLYGQEYYEYAIPAKYIGGSLSNDIAILKVTASDVYKESSATSAIIANSSNVCPGDTAITIGNPEGLGISATAGIVSVASEEVVMSSADELGTANYRLMRIDAAVNGGNSGGGLFDKTGNLIGIVNAKIDAEGIENIAYAIPSNIAINIANNIIESYDGNNVAVVRRGMLGFEIGITNSKAIYNKATQRTEIVETVVVNSVHAKGAGQIAGIEVNDVIKSLTHNGKTIDITRTFMLVDESLNFRVSDTVVINVEREGVSHTLNVVITNTSIVS